MCRFRFTSFSKWNFSWITSVPLLFLYTYFLFLSMIEPTLISSLNLPLILLLLLYIHLTHLAVLLLLFLISLPSITTSLFCRSILSFIVTICPHPRKHRLEFWSMHLFLIFWYFSIRCPCSISICNLQTIMCLFYIYHKFKGTQNWDAPQVNSSTNTFPGQDWNFQPKPSKMRV